MFVQIESPFDEEICGNGSCADEIRTFPPEQAFRILLCGGKRKNADAVLELVRRALPEVRLCIEERRNSEDLNDFVELGLLAGNASVSPEAVELLVETVLESECDMAVAGVLVFCGNLGRHTEEILPKKVFDKCVGRLGGCGDGRETGTHASRCVEENCSRVFASNNDNTPWKICRFF